MAFVSASPVLTWARPGKQFGHTVCMHESSRVSRRALLTAAAAMPALVAMSADAGGGDSSEESWWPPKSMKKLFAEGMETGMGDYELAISRRKRQLFAKLNSANNSLRILDVGIGTGPNLAYLPAGSFCVGLEPNKYMWYVQLARVASFCSLVWNTVG